MFARILLILLITPIVELALLIRLGTLIGFWPTLGVVVVTAVAGSFMLKREGLSVWRRFNDRLNAGGLPGTELVDGVIILLSGALLVTPGVLTDVAGILGLLPPTRAVIRRFVMKRVVARVTRGTASAGFFAFGAEPEPAEPDARTSWGGEPADRPRHQRSDEG